MSENVSDSQLPQKLAFCPLRSFADVTFFHALSSNKLNLYGLDDSEKRLIGRYEVPVSTNSSGILQLAKDSFTVEYKPKKDYIAQGYLQDVNTIEEFLDYDRSALLKTAGLKLLNKIKSGDTTENPSTLVSFLLLSFTNLKKYTFQYWFAFPSFEQHWAYDLNSHPHIQLVSAKKDEAQLIIKAISSWQSTVDINNRGFFWIKKTNNSYVVAGLSSWERFFDRNLQQNPDAYDYFNEESPVIGFADPCIDSKYNPGWPLRNLLIWLQLTIPSIKKIRAFAYRDIPFLNDYKKSVWFNLKLADQNSTSFLFNNTNSVKVIGWERNQVNNKLVHKTADIGALMDPYRLADQAVNLNLKLMRWRLAPDIDLDLIRNTKCLIIGNGPSANLISRGLLAWGIKRISFAGIIKSSFPADKVLSQQIFYSSTLPSDHEKSLDELNPHHLEQILKKIYPGVESSSYELDSLFNLTNTESIRKSLNTLISLIQEYDAIIITDTENFALIPSYISALQKKIFLNFFINDNQFNICNGFYPLFSEIKSSSCKSFKSIGNVMVASGLCVELLASIIQQKSIQEKGIKENTLAKNIYFQLSGSSQSYIVEHDINEALKTKFDSFMKDNSVNSVEKVYYDYWNNKTKTEKKDSPLSEGDINKKQETYKCLLLGSGTLGSYISIGLLASGIKNITFIDSSTISFSNPVRQPLYSFSDSISGKVEKATRASEALKELDNSVASEGIVMSVSMAGHPVTNEKREKSEFGKLLNLIQQCDVLFLLMDSRESRWLPTVLGAANNKIVITTALGFDSFLVMRHGVVSFSEKKNKTFEVNESINIKDERVGCYFCNDVVPPSDSLSDRTLDQMCTVTRPGSAIISTGITIQLVNDVLFSLSKNDLNLSNNNSFFTIEKKLESSSVPHQLRGFLYSFELMKIKGKSFINCAACSNNILKFYNENGWDFVKNCLNDSQFIENVSGLLEMRKQTESMLDTISWVSDTSDDDGFL